MKTDPKMNGDAGRRPSIELPPPIPDRSKEKGRVLKNPAQEKRPKTEKISESGSLDEDTSPPPIPVGTKKKAKTQRVTTPGAKRKTARISDSPNVGPKGAGSASSPKPLKADRTLLFAAILVLIVAIIVVMVITLGSTTPPASLVDSSPATSDSQVSVASEPAQNATNGQQETAVPGPQPNASPAVVSFVATQASSPANQDNASTPSSPTDHDVKAHAKFHEGFEDGQNGDFSTSIADYENALQLKPDYPEAWANMAWDYMKQGDMQKAIVSYRKAVALKRDFGDAWYSLASCYEEVGDANDTDAAIRGLFEVDANRADELLASFPTDFLTKVAVSRYPSLGVLDSPLNVVFRKRYDYYRANEPDYFDKATWPLSLALEAHELMSGSAVSDASPNLASGSTGKDFRWNGAIYEVSPSAWGKLNEKRKVFNAKSVYLERLSERILALESKMTGANWFQKASLTKQENSLQKEWDQREQDRDALGAEIQETLSPITSQ